MPEKPGYRVYDTVQRQYLASFRKPVKGCDVAVTRWTANPECAMRFNVLAAARSAVAWLGDGGMEILDDEGRTVR